MYASFISDNKDRDLHMRGKTRGLNSLYASQVSASCAGDSEPRATDVVTPRQRSSQSVFFLFFTEWRVNHISATARQQSAL